MANGDTEAHYYTLKLINKQEMLISLLFWLNETNMVALLKEI